MTLHVRARWRVLAAVALIAAAPERAIGQSTEWPIDEGDVIRLFAPDGSIRAEGRVHGSAGGSIVLSLPGEPTRMSIRLGEGDAFAIRHALRAADRASKRGLWGLFLGASIGGISGPLLAPGEDEGLSTGTGAVIGAAGGAILGGAIGAATGLLFPQYRWQRFHIRG